MNIDLFSASCGKSGENITIAFNVRGSIEITKTFLTLITLPKEYVPSRNLYESYITQEGYTNVASNFEYGRSTGVQQQRNKKCILFEKDYFILNSKAPRGIITGTTTLEEYCSKNKNYLENTGSTGQSYLKYQLQKNFGEC